MFFARKAGAPIDFLAFWDSGFGRLVIPLTVGFAVGENDEPAARRTSGRSVSAAFGQNHQASPSAGTAGAGDRLGFSGRTLWVGVPRGPRAASAADAAGGRPVHSHPRGLELGSSVRKFVRIALVVCLAVTAVPIALSHHCGSGLGTRLLKLRVFIEKIACLAKCARDKRTARGPRATDRFKLSHTTRSWDT
jgi:hypothetical protein